MSLDSGCGRDQKYLIDGLQLASLEAGPGCIRLAARNRVRKNAGAIIVSEHWG